MANTPQTPVHLTFGDGEIADDTPIDPAAMNVPPTAPLVTKSAQAKAQTKKEKLQEAFARLYDEDDEENLIDLSSPALSSGQTQTSPVTDVMMEDVGDLVSFEMKGEDIGEEMEVLASSSTESTGLEVTSDDGFVIRTEWLGTSQFYLEPLLELQRSVTRDLFSFFS